MEVSVCSPVAVLSISQEPGEKRGRGGLAG